MRKEDDNNLMMTRGKTLIRRTSTIKQEDNNEDHKQYDYCQGKMITQMMLTPMRMKSTTRRALTTSRMSKRTRRKSTKYQEDVN